MKLIFVVRSSKLILEICEKEKAVIYCPEKGCNQTYCEKCFEFTHQSTKNQKHKGMPANKRTEYQCKEHRKIYQSICLKCKEFSCFICCLKGGKHFSHDIMLMEDSKMIVEDVIKQAISRGAIISHNMDKDTFILKNDKHKLLQKIEYIEKQKEFIDKIIKNERNLSSEYNFIHIKYYMKEIVEKQDSINKFEAEPLKEEHHAINPTIELIKSQPTSKRGSWIIQSKMKSEEKRKSNISNLIHSDNWIDNEMKEIFEEYIQLINENDPSLDEILLNGCKLNDENVKTLCRSLAKNSTVTKLDLSGNEGIKGGSVEEICKMIENNTSLREFV